MIKGTVTRKKILSKRLAKNIQNIQNLGQLKKKESQLQRQENIVKANEIKALHLLNEAQTLMKQ